MSDWQDHAACRGMDVDVFVIDDKRHGRGGVYASPHTRVKLSHALAICHTCPVISECRNYLESWPEPPRDVVIAGLTPARARHAWFDASPHRYRRPA